MQKNTSIQNRIIKLTIKGMHSVRLTDNLVFLCQ